MADNLVNQRLRQFIKSKKLTVQRFEELCGLSNGYVRSIKKAPGADKLEAIIRAFPDLNRGWLLSGEGEMISSIPAIDVDIDLKLGGHSQMAFNDINNIGDAKAQLILYRERIKLLESQLKNKDRELSEKDARIEELKTSNERLEKMNDYLMEKK